jgi:hypothetical protein
MATANFTDEVKTRVTRRMKRDLERRAAARELDLSDIVREALRDYFAKNGAPNGKDVAA